MAIAGRAHAVHRQIGREPVSRRALRGLRNRDWQSFNIDEEQIRRGAQGGRGLSPREANRLWSYRDINADVGGYIKPDTLWWYSSVRDQEVAARQVNFPVKPLRTSLTNYSGKATYQATPEQQARRLRTGGTEPSAEPPGSLRPDRLQPSVATTAINESEESTTDQLARGWVWKAEWNAVINDTVFFEVQGRTVRRQPPPGAAWRPRLDSRMSAI